MNKAYIIMAGTGEYSERWTWPAKVFLCKNAAVQMMTELESIERKYSKILAGIESWNARRDEEVRLAPLAVAEYATLGFHQDDGHYYGLHVDWRLEEAGLA